MKTLASIIKIEIFNALSLGSLVILVNGGYLPFLSPVKATEIAATSQTPTSIITQAPRSNIATSPNIPAKSTIKPTPPALNEPLPPADTPPPPLIDNRCLVTIDGENYDVTDFRATHPGGNIFTCGADMSQIFWGQHDDKTLAKMQKYRVP